jgi:two-component system, OmpR family, alkaline phosphatase synthesis response regulator PhoP
MPNIDKKVLVIEDEEPMLNALVKKFENEGFNVFKAHDGEEGLDLALKEKPDVMMVDIIMPKIDGITLVKRARIEGGEWGKDVKIIMLTNLSDPESVSEAANYGVFDFLVKTDWRLDDVVKLVKQKLGLPA